MNYLFLLLIISEASAGIAGVFLSCDLGQRSSDNWNAINLKFDQFDWYLFPNELKRILPIIIAVAQQPAELKCFGSFSLSREVFKKVSQSNRFLELKSVSFFQWKLFWFSLCVKRFHMLRVFVNSSNEPTPPVTVCV